MSAASVILYHRTTPRAAQAILRSGFREASGHYMATLLTCGVWFSDRPLDMNEGAGRDPRSDVLLRLVLPIGQGTLRRYEWIEAGKPYREWQLPASLVNPHRRRLKVVRDV
jgi:hypothetical protein